MAAQLPSSTSARGFRHGPVCAVTAVSQSLRCVVGLAGPVEGPREPCGSAQLWSLRRQRLPTAFEGAALGMDGGKGPLECGCSSKPGGHSSDEDNSCEPVMYQYTDPYLYFTTPSAFRLATSQMYRRVSFFLIGHVIVDI